MSIEPEKHNMVVTRIFGAPVEQVWRAWSDSALVMRWGEGAVLRLAQQYQMATDFSKGVSYAIE